jgi:hypothetical protein
MEEDNQEIIASGKLFKRDQIIIIDGYQYQVAYSFIAGKYLGKYQLYKIEGSYSESLLLDEFEIIKKLCLEIIPIDIIKLERERLEWSLKTFTEATAISSLRKLEAEIKEIESDINAGVKEPEEYADALMCLFDSAGRHGITVEDIIKSFAIKLEKNKKRTWHKNDDNTYSHIKKI